MIVCRIGQNKMADGSWKQRYQALDTSFHEMSTSGICETCGREFKTHSGLRRHVKTKHQREEMSFVCDKCDQRFCTRQTLNAHLIKHKDGETYKCDTCGQVFTYLHNLRRHLKMHPVPQTYTCDRCQQDFSRKDNLMEHRRAIHEQRAQHRCPNCGVSYSLRRHMKNKHAN